MDKGSEAGTCDEWKDEYRAEGVALQMRSARGKFAWRGNTDVEDGDAIFVRTSYYTYDGAGGATDNSCPPSPSLASRGGGGTYVTFETYLLTLLV
jgi:hypothetical protein